MFARLYLFPFGAGERARLEATVDELAPLFATFPGFISQCFFIDEESGVCGTMSQWQTREDGESAIASLASLLSERISAIAGRGFDARTVVLPARLSFEVYTPTDPNAGPATP